MSIQQFSQYYTAVKQLCQSNQALIIYGAGSNGVRVYDYLRQQGCQIIGFSDSAPSKHGQQLLDKPIFSPQQAIATGATIIVASTAYPQIIAHLQSLGAERLYNLSLLGLAKQPFIDDIEAQLNWLQQRLADEDSRQVLHNLLHFLLQYERCTIPMSDYPQYRHPAATPSQQVNLIDGGACVGEIFDTFADYPPAQLRVLCLEPEQSNLALLQQKIVNSSRQPFVEVIPCGLWSTATTLRFSSADQSGSNSNCNVSEDGDIVIHTKAIDQLCQQYHFIPNMIKMDIEGAEVAALEGAADTIRQHKPALAICLYHHLDDLWRIPQYISSLRPDYKMSLGHHTNCWFETVLYCY